MRTHREPLLPASSPASLRCSGRVPNWGAEQVRHRTETGLLRHLSACSLNAFFKLMTLFKKHKKITLNV